MSAAGPDVPGSGPARRRDVESQSTLRPADDPVARTFLAVLGGLLVGYQFLGRGFAHVAVGPIYIGDVVLVVGLLAVAILAVRGRLHPAVSPPILLLIAFMALGAIDTLPYLATYGRDALRDGVLWGYGAFALIVYLLVDRRLVEQGLRLYGWVLPAFALWLPISWTLFRSLGAGIDILRPGEVIPLVFFKSGDMTIHVVGSLAFLVLVVAPVTTLGAMLWRAAVVVPLGWTVYSTGSINRGSLLTTLVGIVSLSILGRRRGTWRPVLLGAIVLGALLAPVTVPQLLRCGQPAASPTPSAAIDEQREVNPCQIMENMGSVIGTSEDWGLQGTKNFRLEWWSTIIDYTVAGPYFWTGKGFGINLADADGFQPTEDHSLRAPHNSHITTLARMGVPGFVLWILLQGTFALGLLRALLRFRRAGDALLAAAAGWIGVYWLAMMVDTTFDPYLEGPQGGIWFWVLLGLGAAVMRMTPRPGSAAPSGIGLEVLAARFGAGFPRWRPGGRVA